MEKSVSGVTASQNQVAKFIRVHNIQSWNIEKSIKVRDFVQETGIKVQRAEIVQMVTDEINRQSEIKVSRQENKHVSCEWHKNRILYMLQHKRYNQAQWAAAYHKAITLGDALGRTYRAAWNANSPDDIQFGGNILRITWDEESDWEYYAKSYGRPKNTYTNRRVELLAPSSTNNYYKIIDSYLVNKFAGQFIVNAIVKFTGIGKVLVPKNLQTVQLNPYFDIKLIKDFAELQIWERTIAGIHADYCAVSRGTTYHAETKKAAIDGLRTKLRAKSDHETELLDYPLARKMGFCDAGIRQFAADNGIDADGQYARAELRNIVIQKRQLNADKYRIELAKMGINISK